MSTLINNLYPFDYIILFIIFLFVFFSVWKGFIQSVLGLMTWIGSIIITLIFYQKLSLFISEKINEFDFFAGSGISEIIGTIFSIPIIFILSLIILKNLRKIISSDLDKATLGKIIDKFLGIIYGLFFSYFIFTISLLFIDSINLGFLDFLLKNSLILENIYLFNEKYLLMHIPFIYSSTEVLL